MISLLEILYLTILIITIILGDTITSITTRNLQKALSDNLTHGIIGGLSWLIFSTKIKTNHIPQVIYEVMLCTLLSCAIDLDHFISARSFKLTDAISLTNRPVLHSSTLPIATTFFLLLANVFLRIKWMEKLGFLIFLSFISHHTRDANRRGYWFAPFGSTPPLPYFVYIIFIISIPYVAVFVHKCIQVIQYDSGDTKYNLISEV